MAPYASHTPAQMGITPHWTLRSPVGGQRLGHERAGLGGHMRKRVPQTRMSLAFSAGSM
jgi:hypothetical protein